MPVLGIPVIEITSTDTESIKSERLTSLTKYHPQTHIESAVVPYQLI